MIKKYAFIFELITVMCLVSCNTENVTDHCESEHSIDIGYGFVEGETGIISEREDDFEPPLDYQGNSEIHCSTHMIDYEDISDRILLRFKNQCLKWYYSDTCLMLYGSKEQEKNDFVNIEPGNEIYYRILTNSSQGNIDDVFVFQIDCSNEESFDTYFTWHYSYSSIYDQISKAERIPLMDLEITRGSFIIPLSMDFSDHLSNKSEYQLVKDQFQMLWDEWLLNQSSNLSSPLKNAYLMPFVVEEDGSADLCVYIEECNGTWIMARPAIDRYEYYSPFYYTLHPTGYSIERKVGWYKSSDYLLLPEREMYGEQLSFWERNQGSSSSDLTIFRGYLPDESGFEVYSYEFYNSSTMSFEYNDEGFGGFLSASDHGAFLKKVPELAYLKLY